MGREWVSTREVIREIHQGWEVEVLGQPWPQVMISKADKNLVLSLVFVSLRATLISFCLLEISRFCLALVGDDCSLPCSGVAEYTRAVLADLLQFSWGVSTKSSLSPGWPPVSLMSYHCNSNLVHIFSTGTISPGQFETTETTLQNF